MVDAKDLAREIGRIGQMQCRIKDCPTCNQHVEDAASIILRRVRRETIDECIKKAKGIRSYEVKDPNDELWDDAVNQVIDTLDSLKAEIGGGE